MRDGGLRTQILGCVQILLVAYNNQRLSTKITFDIVVKGLVFVVMLLCDIFELSK